ncbi:hypothetical protein T07_8074 [Trichinella nelsoni]|uniref:Uncharacterized protein n=1 Tax=Trichinella nelsoni TaxID=6336 RepID=A0A0V0SHG8_9BILA|nr:hypothetical protein T07_8074 [Trichinella nelsoni]
MFIVNSCKKISHLFLIGDDKNNIRFALNFFSNFQDRNKQNSFINQKTLAEICHIRINIKEKKEKGQSDMTKVNGKASEVGLLRRNFDIIQGMLNFLTDLKQAAAPRSYCDVEKN